MAGHWSRDLYTLWWRDRGTGRKRCSFASAPDVLLRRVARIWHDAIDAALWAPDGTRVRIPEGGDAGAVAPEPMDKPKRKARPSFAGAPADETLVA